MHRPPDVATAPVQGAVAGKQTNKSRSTNKSETGNRQADNHRLNQAIPRSRAWRDIMEAVADQRDRLTERLALANHDVERFFADRDLEADVENFTRTHDCACRFPRSEGAGEMSGDKIIKLNGKNGADHQRPSDKEVIEKLAKLSQMDLDRALKAHAALLGVEPATLKTEVKKARKPGKKKPETAPLSDVDLELSAAPVIDCHDVLDLFSKTWAKVMAGEVRNAKLLYLMATTRVFDNCMSAKVTGPSSAG